MNGVSDNVITEDEIIKLAKLSSLELSSEEVTKYQEEVGTILTMIDKLKEINTDGVDPTYQVSGNISSLDTMRVDEISDEVVPKEELLKLAPRSSENEIRAPKVL